MGIVLLALLFGEPLADARTAMDELRFDKALELLDSAERSGANGPKEVTEIQRLRGQALGSMGRADEATTAFRRWLALEPGGRLPEGSSPKIARPFEQAQRLDASLRVHHELSQAGVVTLIVDSDPLNMVAGARAKFRNRAGIEQIVEGRGSGRVPLVLPGGVRLDVELAAIDKFGNRLAVIRDVVIEPSAAVAPTAPVIDEHPESPSLVSRWWLWGGAAVVVAGAGVAFGSAASSAQDDVKRLNADSMNHDFSEAKAREDDANTDALLANISFGVAGACAIVSAIMLYRQQTTVVATPTRGGAAFSVLVRF